MAEEKQTIEIDDTLSQDDVDMLRAVLEDSHSHGMSAVSVYGQTNLLIEE